MHVRNLKFASFAVVILGLLGAWVFMARHVQKAIRPSDGATNLVSFLEIASAPKNIRKFVHNDKTHVEVIGHLPKFSWALLPSGPPAYIFNDAGVLVDWTPDRGDSPSFVKKWGSLSNSEFITAQEATKLLKTPEL